MMVDRTIQNFEDPADDGRVGVTLEDAARADSGGAATQQEALERLARLTARLLRAPAAAVSLIEGGTQMIVGAHGLPG